ncbi:hypothetical protein F5884DRAFT_534790 [Xylogone sp. PMI_703]|nr:hypothetical protein F5884DRAFT_534790 [Xylogone sp. PMI_703]
MSRRLRSANKSDVEIGEQRRPDIEGGNGGRHSRDSNERGYRRISPPRTMSRAENNEPITTNNRPPIIHSPPYDIPQRYREVDVLEDGVSGAFRRGPARVVQTFPFQDIYATDDDNESQAENTDPVPPTELHPALREPQASPSNFATSGRVSVPQALPEIDPSTVTRYLNQ